MGKARQAASMKSPASRISRSFVAPVVWRCSMPSGSGSSPSGICTQAVGA